VVRRTCIALAAAATVAAAAPTAQAAKPRVVDFELRPAPLHRAATGPFTSPPLRAGRRFNLVGLRWASARAPLVSLRVRRNGGRWSRWQRVASSGDHAPDPGSGEHGRGGGESDPLWARKADWVQYRLSRPVDGLVLHFVRATSAARSVRAASTEPQPQIQPRSAWDPGGECKPRAAPSYGEVRVAFVHHTAMASAYSPQDVPGIILSICHLHRDSNGWNDIGYNFVVDRYGTLWEARAGGIDRAVIGAQAVGFNSQSTGIANLGTFDSQPQTDAALSAMAHLIRWKLPLHAQPTAGKVTLTSAGGGDDRWPAGQAVQFDRISGHRDADNTDCPGDALYAQLPDLRNRVAALGSAPTGAPPKLTLAAPPARVSVGRLLKVSGLIDPAKAVVSLLLDRRVGGRWVAYRRIALAASGGAFAKSVRLRKYGLYRVYARFAGDAANAAARSHRYSVRVPRSGP
jgi:hypothetical protein